MKSIIKNLTAEQIEALIALSEECSSYKEACAQARDQLGINLSSSTLCRLYTKHQIGEDAQTRADYTSAAGLQPADLMQLTENQLQLRLLELASRPNPGASDLRALFQIITRLRALVLSERRVIVAERRIALAEKRDHRETQPPPPQKSISPIEVKRRVRIALGKSTDDLPPEPNNEQSPSDGGFDQEMIRNIKRLMGKDITLGDELLAQSPACNSTGTDSSERGPTGIA